MPNSDIRNSILSQAANEIFHSLCTQYFWYWFCVHRHFRFNKKCQWKRKLNRWNERKTIQRIFQLNRMELPTFFTLIIWHSENVECPISLCEFQIKCRQAQAIKKEITYFMRHCALKQLTRKMPRTEAEQHLIAFPFYLLWISCFQFLRRSKYYANWCGGELRILLLSLFFFFCNLTSNQLNEDADMNGEYLWHFIRIPRTK